MRRPPLPLLALALAGCAAPMGPSGSDSSFGAGGKADSSAEATFIDMEFDGELVTTSAWSIDQQIETQLLYTVGLLNGERSVSRLDRVQITNVDTASVEGGTRVTYHARLPVAWGRRENVPSSYTLRLPRDVSSSGQQSFMDKYGHACVDYGAHDVDAGILWYYYRPDRQDCHLEAADIVDVAATVSHSDIETTGKYPEYHEVWKDGVLRVVAIFGKYEDGATANDAGISGYNRFVRAIRDELSGHSLVTEPAELPSSVGVETPEIVLRASMGEGRDVEVHAMLVDSIQSADATFNARYAELSTRADLIAYNGHSGLGANIRALARKGRWEAEQYVVVFMNGCDTYAYVDAALAEAHAAVNPDDPNGTKHLDIVTNAMPSLFSSMPYATMALVRGLLSYDQPRTYEQIFEDIDSSQVVLVSGEQDNVYVPGDAPPPPPPGGWTGMEESGTVAQGEEVRFETPTLTPGRYTFVMDGTGDADLYVRVGTAPTTQVYDCRPYDGDSTETCEVALTTEAVVHVMVQGYAASSDWHLVGQPQ